MAEITDRAYQNLREYIVKNWTNRIHIKDQIEVNRGVVLESGDERVRWIHERGKEERKVDEDRMGRPIFEDVEIEDNQVLQLQITIKGSDDDVYLPMTVEKLEIKGEVKGEPFVFIEEEFEPFTLENEDDELVIIQNIEVPKLN